MNHIDMIIPTRFRQEKLAKTIASIPSHPWLKVHVVCDGDKETFEWLKNECWDFVKPHLMFGHNGAVDCRNWIISCIRKPDGILYATDDIEFDVSAIEKAKASFNYHFGHDDDGVIGFSQDKDHNQAGVGLIGRRFLNRYPDRMPFFPSYYHFACQEIKWLADKLGRFYYEPEAMLKHFHPDFYPDLMDQTHVDGRIHRELDHKLIEERKKKGLIWGL